MVPVLLPSDAEKSFCDIRRHASPVRSIALESSLVPERQYGEKALAPGVCQGRLK